MAKIKTFDKATIKDMRDEINTALDSLGKKYGLSFNIGSITYQYDSFTAKMKVMIVDKSEIGMDPRELEFKKNLVDLGWKYNLSLKDLGKTFHDSQLGKVQFVGLKARSGKYPLIIKSLSNDKYYHVTSAYATRIRQGAVS
jgi:hypothetical protein